MITVTCRNGERYAIDPDHIERVEACPDTVIILADGGKYVVDQGYESVLRWVRDYRAAAFVARNRLVDGFAATPSAVRLGRRRRNDGPRGVTLLPSADGD